MKIELSKIQSVTDMIVAVAQNDAIGQNGTLLIPIKEDLKRFKRLTAGDIVICGRKTLASFPNGRPLSNRTHWVLSRTLDNKGFGDQVLIFDSIDALYEKVCQYVSERGIEDTPYIHIIGGATIYHALLSWAGTIECTEIHQVFPEADTFLSQGWLDHFDLIWHSEWKRSDASKHTNYRYCTYKRIAD